MTEENKMAFFLKTSIKTGQSRPEWDSGKPMYFEWMANISKIHLKVS